jgi:hypothetical protein
MQAEVLEISKRFEVQPAMRDDGTTGPPYRITLTTRPCWRKPPVTLQLAFLYEVQNVAYYDVVNGNHIRDQH